MGYSTCRRCRWIGTLIAGTLLAALAAGCAKTRSTIPLVTELSAPDTARTLDVTRVYRLGAGDTVTIQVYRAPDLSGDRQVDDAGQIAMPLAGTIDAQGLTVSELGTKLSASLQRYYQQPQVAVSLKEAISRRVTVDGAVKAPGIYPVDANTTLLRSVALAQGTSEYANTRRVVVFRTIDGQRQAAAFDLRAIRDGRAPDPAIFGSDVIVVDGNDVRLALRDILQAIPLLAIFRPF